MRPPRKRNVFKTCKKLKKSRMLATAVALFCTAATIDFSKNLVAELFKMNYERAPRTGLDKKF